jgi:hypothetical protein
MSQDRSQRPEAIEAIVLATTTSESSKAGKTRKVTFQIPADGPNPFEGMGGERIHLVVVRLNNDETPAKGLSSTKVIEHLTAGEHLEKGDVVVRHPGHERKGFLELKRSAQAVLRCKETRFWEFLDDYSGLGLAVVNEALAADAVRMICGVDSRSELNTRSEPGTAWDRLEAEYYAWIHGRH